MKITTALALALGLAVTLSVVGADALGLLTGWERQSVDSRFRHAPRRDAWMTDEIVHVDIDDGALDSVGRWPWDRGTLALVIDELRAAGARTIALDLILTDAQQYPQGSAPTIDHDALFAEALAGAGPVLAVNIDEDEPYDAAWRTPEGAAQLERLLEALGRNIELPTEDVARTIPDFRLRDRFRARPLEFKKAAAWRVLARAAEPPVDFAAFERLVAPERDDMIDEYPEQPLLRSVWSSFESWQIVRPMLLPGGGGGSHRDRVPLPPFVRSAAWIGSVGIGEQKHPDGAVREISVSLRAPGGRVLALGLAAAATHRGLGPDDVAVGDDTVAIGEMRLPLRDGRLWIAWPRSAGGDVRWETLLRAAATGEAGEDRGTGVPGVASAVEGPEMQRHTAGHVSIGAIVSLAEQRLKHAGNLRAQETLARVILPEADIPEGGLTDEVIADVEDQVAFLLEEYETLTDLAPEEREQLAELRAWALVAEVVEAGAERIARVARTLREHVEDKLVFVGWTATGAAADFVQSVLDSRTPGVVVHAVVADMLLSGRAVTFTPPWANPVAIVVLGVLCTIAAARFTTAPSTAVVLALLALYLAVAVWLFGRHDLVVPLVAPLGAGAASWIACTALQAAISQRDRKRITRQFRSRVSVQLVDHLVRNPEALTMSGEEREVTVIIGDLAGFTALSERLGGARTVTTLNRYLKALTDVVIAEDAYMNKFLGDGFMAFWSAFETDPAQAVEACRAALRCAETVDRLNHDEKLQEELELGDLTGLRLRVGVATGRVVVGDCGAPPDLNDYTVIGDAVNLAARLESANKQFGTSILTNGRTRELAADAPVALRPVGKIRVVGQTTPVEIFEVLPPDAPRELIEISARLVAAYEAGDFGGAAAALDELEERYGPSGLIDLYRRDLEVVREDFDGALQLREK